MTDVNERQTAEAIVALINTAYGPQRQRVMELIWKEVCPNCYGPALRAEGKCQCTPTFSKAELVARHLESLKPDERCSFLEKVLK